MAEAEKKKPATKKAGVKRKTTGKRKPGSPPAEKKHTIVQRSPSSLVPHARNSKKHPQEQINQIRASIREFGFARPVVIDDTDIILAGHGAVLAAMAEGLSEIPCAQLSGLTEAQKRAYIVADNKIAENAEWDWDLLGAELKELEGLIDISITGFSDEEMSKLMDLDTKDKGLTDPDFVPEVQIVPTSCDGDVWVLGSHRLMCGDSTSMTDVDRLLGGETADLVFTDPPYNVAFNGRSGKHDVIKNDNLPEKEFGQFIDAVLEVISSINPEAYYIWCNWDFYGVLQGKLPYKSCIVWAKNVFGMGIGYRHQHEFCLFNGSIDDHIKNESDLWEIKKDSNYVHPTQKPVALSVRAFSNHIKLLNVLDLFGGSGSTLIGAEQTGRKAFLMELDPKYVDVIIKRWEDFTGNRAVHEETGKSYVELANERGVELVDEGSGLKEE